MYQFFSRPDAQISLCGDLRFHLAERRIPGAPDFMRGLRALFVSDIHADRRTSDDDMARFAARLAEARPDIAFWGGDFADSRDGAARLIEHLSALCPRLGSFAVPGNNDREAWPELGDLRRALARSGVRLLVNESAPVSANGGSIVVAGVDEYRHGCPDASGLYPTEASGACYRVLLSHFPVMPAAMPDLMLSGHTHGGQFNLFGVTPYTIGFERLYGHRASRFISGQHEYRGAQVIVSKGIGASRLPLRIGVRPEAELLRFE